MTPTPRPARTDVCKPDEDRPDTEARWRVALARALDAGLTIRPGLFGLPLWTVTSKSRPDLCHATDGVRCSCAAGAYDPVCMHRSLYRAVRGLAPFAPAAIPANVVPFRRRETPRPAA